MQVESVAGPALCAGLVQDFECVGSEACGGGSDSERKNIWAVGAHVGCQNGHFAWDCHSKGLGKMKLFGRRCCIGKRALQRWDACFSAVSLEEEENSARAARALGRNQKEVAGFVADKHYAKECPKGQGKAYHLADWSEDAGTNEVRELEGSLRAIESGPVKQTTQKVGCDGVCPQSGPALRTLSDWITVAGKQSDLWKS